MSCIHGICWIIFDMSRNNLPKLWKRIGLGFFTYNNAQEVYKIHILNFFFQCCQQVFVYWQTYQHTAVFYSLHNKLREGRITKATPETCLAEWLLMNICIAGIGNFGALCPFKSTHCWTGLCSHNVNQSLYYSPDHIYRPLPLHY